MNDLDRALGDIRGIRRQMADTTEFYGYGPATLMTTAALAVAAAMLQREVVPDPSNHGLAYLSVWMGTAAVCVVLSGWQMFTRTRRLHSGLSNEMLRMAVEQFVPAAGAGLLLSIVLPVYVPAVVWMLPGLWQIIFGLGVLSSCRFLPGGMHAAGIWYSVTGLSCLAMGGDRAFSPWAMGVPFGVGQALIAAILFFGARKARENA